MGIFNSTCPIPNSVIKAPNDEEPILGNMTFQHLMFYIAGGFMIITAISSIALAITHLSCYVRPREQRQIIRIIFYPFFFAIFSCFSILDYPASLYLLPLNSIYEPVALVAIFFLFMEYAHDDPSSREEYFLHLPHQRTAGGKFGFGGKWVIEEGGCLRWFHAKYVALFIYFVASILIEIVELITQAAGKYCEYTYSLAFAHIYVVVVSDVALGVGVLAVVQFYLRMKREPHFKSHNPTGKILSFKGVIALMFLQETIFGILTGHNVWTNHPKITIRDQQIAIQQALVCMEMMIVTLIFWFTFRAAQYREIKRTSSARPMNIFLAAANALNPTDIFIGAAQAIHLLMAGTGPVGNGSWRKSGGYQTVPKNKGRQSRMANVGRTQKPLSGSASSGSPPAYSDRRPLRDASPYRISSEYNGAESYNMEQRYALPQEHTNLSVPGHTTYQPPLYPPYRG